MGARGLHRAFKNIKSLHKIAIAAKIKKKNTFCIKSYHLTYRDLKCLLILKLLKNHLDL